VLSDPEVRVAHFAKRHFPSSPTLNSKVLKRLRNLTHVAKF